MSLAVPGLKEAKTPWCGGDSDRRCPPRLVRQRILYHACRNGRHAGPAEFRQFAVAGDRISQADLAMQEKINAAAVHAATAQMIMRADLDGDGDVTEEELREVLRRERLFGGAASGSPGTFDERLEEQIARLMKADTDHDGRTIWTEALAFASQQPAAGSLYNAALIRQVLAFDSRYWARP
jgi:hypothetical protein